MWSEATAPPETPPETPKAPKAEDKPKAEHKPLISEENVKKAASAAGRGIYQTLAERRGLRIVLIGIAVVWFAIWVGDELLVPLLLLGTVLIIAGAVGPRLQGRFSVDFGPDGSLFELKAHLAPPGHKAVTSLPAGEERPQLTPVAPPESPAEAEVIESHGETIELDVERLKRLLAAEDEKAASG